MTIVLLLLFGFLSSWAAGIKTYIITNPEDQKVRLALEVFVVFLFSLAGLCLSGAI